MSQVVFNLGYLFPEPFHSDIIAASELQKNCAPLLYELGQDSLPHVTVLQFEGQSHEASGLIKALSACDFLSTQVHFCGLAIDRWKKWDALWLKVKHNEKLFSNQNLAVSVLGERNIINGVGENFEPHATLCAWPYQETVPQFVLPDTLINKKDVPIELHLGISGPNFQFKQSLSKIKKNKP